MEQNLAAVWTCLLGAGLVLVLPTFSSATSMPPPRPPWLLGCVFLQRANVTCRWEPGDPQPTTTMHYTLQVDKMRSAVPWAENNSLIVTDSFDCTTSNTSCTVGIRHSNVAFIFCITITARFHGSVTSSAPRCQSGRKEVMLAPVTLLGAKPVSGRPRCLMLTWRRSLSYAASPSEIKDGILTSQIEVAAEGQPGVQITDVVVKNISFMVCCFRPDTSYTIRLRHRFLSAASPWSPWSNGCQGQTGEDAPSAAPAFWRQVNKTSNNGWRLVSLLWQPLPHFLANGKVLSYNVTCQKERGHVLKNCGSCEILDYTRTSCRLLLPTGRCSCSLTASNSAGTSPEAQIWLLGASETEPPPPSQTRAVPLDDNSLDVRWTAPTDLSLSGFVVEWFKVTERRSSMFYWDVVNSSCTSLVITEGVEPMVRYAVTVKVLHGERGTGQNRTLHVYTRQGAPSAGPKVEVHEISGSSMTLSWDPVPVELLHGYIRHYTLHYTHANQQSKRVFVSPHVRQYSLKNLLPGNYDIYMTANTDAGDGAAGPTSSVNIIGSEEVSVVVVVVVPLILMSLILVLMVCLSQQKMVKQKLYHGIPDPSHSSLALWSPKAPLQNMKQPPVAEKPEISYPVIILLGNSETLSSEPVEDFSYHNICDLQTYSSRQDSPLPATLTQTPCNSRRAEKEHIRFPTTEITSENMSHTDALSFCPSIYSSVLCSLQTFPSSSTISIHDNKLQLETELLIPPQPIRRPSGTLPCVKTQDGALRSATLPVAAHLKQRRRRESRRQKDRQFLYANQRGNMTEQSKKFLLVLVDVLCVIVAALPSIILTVMFSPFQQGIYCDDQSISYPYKRDTISQASIGAVTISCTVFIITTGEAYLVYSKRLHSNSQFNQYLSALYKVVGTFLFGGAVSQSLTDIAKFTIGRPRPNFLSVCAPVTCNGYMVQINCTGNPVNVTESRLSFYSGHSSFSMYCMLFLTVSVCLL
ncbi:hypothetical protein LDENG_00181550 [Lucifuga dentata]|nr:hypothetical protein LDENG_00181550 [Lucifuga dentata]